MLTHGVFLKYPNLIVCQALKNLPFSSSFACLLPIPLFKCLIHFILRLTTYFLQRQDKVHPEGQIIVKKNILAVVPSICSQDHTYAKKELAFSFALHGMAFLSIWPLKSAVSSERLIPAWQVHKIGKTYA